MLEITPLGVSRDCLSMQKTIVVVKCLHVLVFD